MSSSDNQSNNSQTSNSNPALDYDISESNDTYKNDVGNNNIKEITIRLNNQDKSLNDLILSQDLSNVEDNDIKEFQAALRGNKTVTEIQIFSEILLGSQDVSGNLSIIRDYLPPNLELLNIPKYSSDLFEPLSKCNNLKELTINNKEELDEKEIKNLTELKKKNLGLEIIDENDKSIHNYNSKSSDKSESDIEPEMIDDNLTEKRSFSELESEDIELLEQELSKQLKRG